MKPFFSTTDRLLELHREASTWMGTPWIPNSEVKGGGVSCHNLPRSIFIAVGALAPEFPKVVGDPVADRYAKLSRMETFIDGRPEFVRVARGDIQPGDMLGIRICRCIDHLGIALESGLFIHVLMHKHTSADYREVPPWQERISAVWRPVEV